MSRTRRRLGAPLLMAMMKRMVRVLKVAEMEWAKTHPTAVATAPASRTKDRSRTNSKGINLNIMQLHTSYDR